MRNIKRLYWLAALVVLLTLAGIGGVANAALPNDGHSSASLPNTGSAPAPPPQAAKGSGPTTLSNAGLPPGAVPARPAVPFVYVEKAPEPVTTDRHAASSVAGFLYIVGGEYYNGTTYAITSTVQRFDPVGNTWQFMAPLPVPFDNMESCAMNGKIYVPGGYNGAAASNVNYIYDVAGNTWTTGAPVPSAPGNLWSTVVCNAATNKVYAIGGYNLSAPLASNYIYDATANTWSSGANIPVATYGSDGGLIGGNIYMAGGLLGTTTYAYNLAGNTWSTVAPMAVGCYFGASGVSPDNRLYIAGGGFCSNGASPTGRTERYDPVANTWTTVDTLNEAVYHTNGGFAPVGSNLFNVVGGYTGAADIPNTQQLAVAVPGTPSATPTGPIPTATQTAIATATACAPTYNITTGAGAIVPGTTKIDGVGGDDILSLVTLPFSYTTYDNSYSSAQAGSNGALFFGAANGTYAITCIPNGLGTYTIGPYWTDQNTATNACPLCGIFTSTSGTAPNRIFNIEWRNVYFGQTGAPTLDYEVRLYEGQTRFDVVYGLITALGSANDSALTVGVQKNTTVFTQVGCDPTGGTAPPVATGQLYTYTLAACGTATTTATATAVAATATATATATAVANTATSTATACPLGQTYSITNSAAAIVPGVTDTGNHCDDCHTAVTLPFPITLYDQTFTTAQVGSNGDMAFGTPYEFFYSGCLPQTTPTYTIFPFAVDQITGAAGKGIFTLTTGSAPNRTFYVEWRACRYNGATTCLAGSDNNYEIVFQEGQTNFQIVYGVFGPSNATVGAIGVQKNGTVFTQSQCNAGAPASTAQIYTLACIAASPTPTNTATPVANTATRTATSVPPTLTATPVPPTLTRTATSVPPTLTATPVLPTAVPSTQPTLAPPTLTATSTVCVPNPGGWTAGANFDAVAVVRAVGIYFPTNGKFYAMGGRTADAAGSDLTNPHEYNPATNTWATKTAVYPDNQVNNMACGVMTVGGVAQIYCVGGSAAGAATATARVFSYNPLTDVITLLGSDP
ncbi:MAG: kelch repeat-containing protein, partial [Chloroflexia bacterium]